MSRQEWNQMLSYTDRAYTRTAAAMWWSKRLVQIQVTNVCTYKSRIGQSYLCIHVGTIHIYLCATRVDDFTDFLYFRLEDTMRWRIGDHQCSQCFLVLFGFGTQVAHIYVSLLVASAGDGFKSGLYGRCRIRTVCRSRNQYFVAMSLTNTFKIRTDNSQTGIFSRSTRVRLQADTCKSGNNLQVLAQIADQFTISFRLIFRHQRMHAHKFRTA